MATAKETSTITIDLQVLLVPLTILISAIMISLSIIYAFNGKTTKSTTTTTVAQGDGTVESLVEEIGVNTDDYKACIDDNTFTEEIEKDTTDGQTAGISGTPGFIVGTIESNGEVNGVTISGAQPYSVFQQEIDKQLNGSGEKTVKVSIDDDPVKGNKDKAKVAIVEFSDFECPYCQRFHKETIDQIISNYVDNDKIIYVYRDFPLSFHEPKASEAAVAANCVRKVAGDDKFFEFSKLYYASTKANGEGL